MGAYQTFDAALVASALDWWADAGVDLLVEDVPRDWFAAPPPPRPAAADAPPPVPALPATLEAFAAWRAGPDAPDAGWSGAAVAASGPTDAALMVLLDCPDREDGDAGALLAGIQGRLFDRMLAAIGLSRDTIHLAAVCARRPVAGRMPRETEARLSDISKHHVGLVAPKRLLCLGNAASRAILGAEMPGTRGSLHGFHHKGGETGVVASFHPRFLLEKPVAKAEAWKDLQLLMGNLSA